MSESAITYGLMGLVLISKATNTTILYICFHCIILLYERYCCSKSLPSQCGLRPHIGETADNIIVNKYSNLISKSFIILTWSSILPKPNIFGNFIFKFRQGASMIGFVGLSVIGGLSFVSGKKLKVRKWAKLCLIQSTLENNSCLTQSVNLKKHFIT